MVPEDLEFLMKRARSEDYSSVSRKKKGGGGGGEKLQLDNRTSNSKRQINEIFFHPISIERLLGPTSLIQNG